MPAKSELILRLLARELERQRAVIDGDRHLQRLSFQIKLDRQGRPVAVTTSLERVEPLDDITVA